MNCSCPPISVVVVALNIVGHDINGSIIFIFMEFNHSSLF